MPDQSDIRIDKWLWAVRIYKSRSLAASVCKQGRVSIDGVAVKPSRIIQVGDIVSIRRTQITNKYKVTGLLTKRQSHSVAVENYKDITPESEKEKLKMQRYIGFEIRDRGAGRPTKKERRIIEKIKGKRN